jgi:hypothetical protein
MTYFSRRTFICATSAALAMVGCNKKPPADDEETDEEEAKSEAKSKKKSLGDEVEVADGKNFTGSWQTGWGKVTLVQSGSKVSGSFTGQFTGSLEGELEGDVLKLTWRQTNSEHGKAKFTLKEGGESFKGTWGKNASSTDGGPWSGQRL